MPIFVGDDIIKDDHPIEAWHNIRRTQRLAAIHKMLIDRGAVFLFLCLHNPPCADQLGIRCDEVLAHTVRSVLFPHYCVGDMIDAQPFHDPRSDNLVKRLLAERVAAAFDETTLTVQDFPSFF